MRKISSFGDSTAILFSSSAGLHGLVLMVLLLAMAIASPIRAATAVGSTPGSFRVTESGAAAYTIPITVPPGTAGMAPNLSLNYNSQGGNGVLGVGWSLGGLSGIHRCPATVAQDGAKGGINYDGNDRFCLDGQRLVAVSGGYGADGAEYRTETESYARIISYGKAGSGPAWFKVWTKAGQIMEYGNTDDSRIEAQGRADVRLWGVNKVSDTKGNYWTASYAEDNANGEAYVSRVDYTGNDAAGVVPFASVQFGYETRVDVSTDSIEGSVIALRQRISNIKAYNGAILVKDYKLAYANNGVSHVGANGSADGSLLIKVQECDGVNSTPNCLNPINLTWVPGKTQANMFGAVQALTNYEVVATGDVNGDGRADVIYRGDIIRGGTGTSLISSATSTLYLALSTGTGLGAGFPLKQDNGYYADGGAFIWSPAILADVNGDGLADFLSGTTVQLSTTKDFGAARIWSSDTIVAAGDVNGDGRADVIYRGDIIRGGTGTSLISSATSTLYLALSTGTGLGAGFPLKQDNGYYADGGAFIWSPAILADVNGDGLADFLSGTTVQLSTTKDFGAARIWSSGTIVAAGDVNGDNRADVIYRGDIYGGSATSFVSSASSTLYLALSTGAGLGTGLPLKEDSGYSVRGGSYNAFIWSPVFLDDVNGDGSADHVYNNSGKSILSLSSSSTPDFLTSFANGFGNLVAVTYKALSDSSAYSVCSGSIFPIRDVLPAVPIYSVSSVSSGNGLGGTYTTNYTYIGAKAHLTGGGFLGFHQIAATDAQTGIVTTTTYGQDYPYQGLPLSVEKRTQTGRLLNQIQNTWQNTSLGAGAYHRSDLVQTLEQSWDLNGTAMPRTKTTTQYDTYGNATQITVATDGSYTTTPVNPYGNVKVTKNTYSNDTANWRLGRLTRATVTSTLPSGASATRTSAFAYEPGSGLLIQEAIEPDIASLRLTTDYTLDVFGNCIATTTSGADIATRTSRAAFDAQGRFAVSVTNALGHTETRNYDPAFGNPLSLTGPNSLTTAWAYDGFGRKTQENRPDGTQSTYTYAWCGANCPAGAVYTATTATSGAPGTTAYFDSLNREIRRETVGFDGRIAMADTQYDSWGRVAAKSRPYFAGDAIAWTKFKYDILGRPVSVTEPDGGVTLTGYNGLAATVTNAFGYKTQQIRNGLGQVVKTIDPHGSVLRFAFDPFGNPTRTTDPKGNAVTLAYDLRGRKIAMTDPDMGTWSYAYNALGELVRQKDAKGQVSTLSYDLLGRMKQRKELGLTSTWTWDTAAKGIGKLAKKATGNGWSRGYQYDAFGRPIQAKTMIGSTSYVLATQYDTYGRVRRITYPTGFTVVNVYNGNGYLSEVRDAANGKVFWQAGEMDAAGRVVREAFGNGLVTRRDYDAVGRTTGIATGPFGSATIQNINLTYDQVGNLVNRDDYVTGRSDMFTYDEVNRLVSDFGTDGKLLSYQYDEIGNITYKSDVGSYTYGTKPHAVVKISGTVNAGFIYDANGNQTQGLNRALSYTAWNMPAKIVQGAATLTYSYDANHERFRQIGPAGTTIYLNPRVDLGGHFEQTVSLSGVKESRHHIYADGEVVGEMVITGTGAKETHYFHADQLGSINVVTNDAGAILARYDYDPFGARTLLAGSPNATRHGFTGHEHLVEVNLIHMNGRVYDPLIARFLSADPYIQFPDNLQSYNRYSYVLNNPLAFTDPSGYGLFSKIGKLLSNSWKAVWHNPILNAAIVITASYFTAGLATYAYAGIAGISTTAASTSLAGSIFAGSVSGMTANLMTSNGNLKAGLEGAILGGVTGAFLTWHTTDWEVSDPKYITKSMLDVRRINWDQMALKVASESVARGTVYTAFGKDFRAGFLSALAPAAASEIYNAYVPWMPEPFGPGGPGGTKSNDGIIVYRDTNNFGRWMGSGGRAVEGGAFSRMMDGNIFGMDAISKVHDVWAVSFKNSLCESDACASTMIPAAGLSFGALSNYYRL